MIFLAWIIISYGRENSCSEINSKCENVSFLWFTEVSLNLIVSISVFCKCACIKYEENNFVHFQCVRSQVGKSFWKVHESGT